jgi:hypothetical protein
VGDRAGVELISDLLGFLLPVALLGPIGALAARQVRIALAAAFGPALVCLLVVVLSSQTAWGGQRVTDGGDMSNSAALLLSIPLFVVVGAAGLALGRGLQVASAHRQSAPGQD